MLELAHKVGHAKYEELHHLPKVHLFHIYGALETRSGGSGIKKA